MNKLLKLLLPAFILLALLVAGCPSGDNGDNGNGNGTELKGPITVSSKLDEEGGMLGQMIILMLEANGFDVVDKTQLGGTSTVRAAIIAGEVDIYPEYTGNGAFFFDGTDPDIWRNAQLGYEKVKELDKAENNIVWLGPAPANNTWAIAIPITLAQQENLVTLADLATYVNGGGFIKLAASAEFISSPAALPAFQEAYGFVLSGDQLLSFAGGDTGQTEQAASQGIDGVNAAMAFGTDGELIALGLVILEDPLFAQPIYEPTPIVRGVIFDQYPELATILDSVFATLDTETLKELNAKVGLEGQLPADVARDYLTEKGFL
jgi:osmoprotectant transport system substrate-binding protein